MVAFEIDALVAAANTARNLTDSQQPLVTVRAILDRRLGRVEATPS